LRSGSYVFELFRRFPVWRPFWDFYYLEGNCMNEAVFKTTMMGGFNKSDVLAFIDKQDRQFKDREKDLLARVESLSKDLKGETQKSGELSQRVVLLETQLEQAHGKNDETDKKALAVEAGATEAKLGFERMLEQRDAELVRLRGEAAGLAERLAEAEKKAAEAEARADAFAGKLELIDKTEDQIGRALLEAQQTADKIIRAANVEAEAQILSTKARVKAINDAEQQKLDLLLGAVSDYDRRVSQTRAEIAAFFTSTDSAFEMMRNGAQEILANFTLAFRTDDPEEPAEEEPCEPDPLWQDDTKNVTNSVKFDFSRSDDRD
jgi:hypothetical protein